MSTHTSDQTSTQSGDPRGAERTGRHETITIHIDKQPFRVPEGTMTAEALRALPTPRIGPDRDLYLEVKGPGEDVLIEPGTSVVLEEAMHFFSAPSTITPGHDR
jgi:hypothetical protein